MEEEKPAPLRADISLIGDIIDRVHCSLRQWPSGRKTLSVEKEEAGRQTEGKGEGPPWETQRKVKDMKPQKAWPFVQKSPEIN